MPYTTVLYSLALNSRRWVVSIFDHLLLICVRVSALQNWEIGPVAGFISMKGFNDLLADLRRFEPVIGSEPVDFHQHRPKRRPTLQTQLADLFLQGCAKSSARELQSQGRHAESLSLKCRSSGGQRAGWSFSKCRYYDLEGGTCSPLGLWIG